MNYKQFIDVVSRESNYLEFTHSGFDCQIIRHSDWQHLCGYIFLTSDSKFFGVNYDNIHISIHGGWTYSDFDESGKLWKIGFDCGHFDDMNKLSFILKTQKSTDYHSNSTYRTIEWVRKELETACGNLAKETYSFERVEKIKQIFKK